MIIIIPVDENKTNVCVSFGRTPYFLIHNTETNATKYEVNPAADAPGGAGLQSSQFIVDQGADVLITVRCGQNAADVLTAADIKIYQSIKDTADANLKAFEDGTLSVLDHFHAGFHGIQ